MTWIDERVEQLRKFKERRRKVSAGAVGLFENLWEELAMLVKEAHARKMAVGTNGSGYRRVVWKSSDDISQAGERRELVITLHKEREQISATGGSVSVSFSFDLCDDGTICLKYNESIISIHEACRLILDPFLFPELQPKDNR